MSALLDNETRSESGPVVGEPSPSLTPERAKALLVVAFRPVIVALVLIATATVVTLVIANSELTGTSGAIAAGWLAVHQVQLTIGSASLGVLPLLPTLGLVWLVARTTARAVTDSSTRREIGWVVGAAVGGPLVVTIVGLAVIKDASGVIALAPPNTLASFAWVLALHLFGAGLGIGFRLRSQVMQLVELPPWVGAVGTLALQAGRRLAIGATVVTVVSLFAHWSNLTSSLDTADGFVGGLGMTVLSLLYLPNVVVGAGAVVTGSAFHVGAGSVGLFSVVGGPVPGLPVLAAVPAGPAAPWWPALLVLPAVVGVALGRESARVCADRISAAQAAAAAAGIVGVAMALLGLIGGGNLGVFGHVGADAFLFGLLSFAWLALLGAGAAMVLGHRASVEVDEDEPEVADEVFAVADDAEDSSEADLPEESQKGDD
ncbi:cell division protein PerM [Antrihabitans cavernicola]|uniref:Uncharacterized protein n=1 Tax=Antrihabitans cavernicola TaxID=2495913 RepID=A0A5A7SGJ4_9NOCA|nr:DUF6350 family protein [Spelaeibacter cavernicola]KAA0023763.1 hypothetical protein FOY51_03920 [Spelaeibacter cavernicola]